MNLQLNDTTRFQQSVNLEQKLTEYTERFKNASDAVQTRMLQDINRELDKLERESNAHVQDPPEFTGRCTYGRGGSRRLTAAEIAENELAKNDKLTKRDNGNRWASTIETVDLTISNQSVEEVIVVVAWTPEKVSAQVNQSKASNRVLIQQTKAQTSVQIELPRST